MTRVADAVADCIDEYLSGGAGLEKCLEAHAEYREEIEQLLSVLSRIRGLPEDVRADPRWIQQTRAAIEGMARASCK